MAQVDFLINDGNVFCVFCYLVLYGIYYYNTYFFLLYTQKFFKIFIQHSRNIFWFKNYFDIY